MASTAKKKIKYPQTESMIPGSKGLVFNTTITPRSILIELYDPIRGDVGEPYEEFLERCIQEVKNIIDKSMRDYATSS